jgi:hypothetical protein
MSRGEYSIALKFMLALVTSTTLIFSWISSVPPGNFRDSNLMIQRIILYSVHLVVGRIRQHNKENGITIKINISEIEFYCLPLYVSVLMGPPSSSVYNKHDKLIEISVWIHIVGQRLPITKVVENRALCYDDNFNIEILY